MFASDRSWPPALNSEKYGSDPHPTNMSCGCPLLDVALAVGRQRRAVLVLRDDAGRVGLRVERERARATATADGPSAPSRCRRR